MHSLRVMAAKADGVSAIRTETFRGRNYTVVPVVALVEGVLQGLNAETPEYAPAEEFGKFPLTWDGRPIVMNHPRRNGELTSANAPDMREEYEFGFMANTVLDNGKLKTEAWIDDELTDEKGGEFLETKNRLLEGEMVEVSTGLFCDVFQKKGTHNGTKYSRVWANVVPDHLAFLSEGTLGACSAADGCGAPRLNEIRLNAEATNKGGEVVTGAPANLGAPHEACCEACAKGDSCMATNQGGDDAQPTEDPNTPKDPATEGEPEGQPTDQPGSGEEQPEGVPEVGDGGVGDEAQPEVEPTPEQVAQTLEANERAAVVLDNLAANAVAPSITLDNARTLVQQAIREYIKGYAYVLAMTTDQVAFEAYNCAGFEEAWGTAAMNYSVSADGGVTLTGEPVPVNLMISIVPRTAVTVNEGIPGANQQKEGLMADENTATTTGEPEAGAAVSANGAGDPPATPRTLEQYLAEAPPELRPILNESIELRTQRKTKLVQGILANSKVFTEEELKGKDIPELEKLAALSKPVQDFSGRVTPRFVDQTGGGITDNERQDVVPLPPRAFEAKPVRKADYSADAAVN